MVQIQRVLWELTLSLALAILQGLSLVCFVLLALTSSGSTGWPTQKAPRHLAHPLDTHRSLGSLALVCPRPGALGSRVGNAARVSTGPVAGRRNGVFGQLAVGGHVGHRVCSFRGNTRRVAPAPGRADSDANAARSLSHRGVDVPGHGRIGPLLHRTITTRRPIASLRCGQRSGSPLRGLDRAELCRGTRGCAQADNALPNGAVRLMAGLAASRGRRPRGCVRATGSGMSPFFASGHRRSAQDATSFHGFFGLVVRGRGSGR